MIVLGIHDGHDAGAALVKDGQVLAAISEERLNNIKNYFGPPLLSIKKAYEKQLINKNLPVTCFFYSKENKIIDSHGNFFCRRKILLAKCIYSGKQFRQFSSIL